MLGGRLSAHVSSIVFSVQTQLQDYSVPSANYLGMRRRDGPHFLLSDRLSRSP